MKRIVAIGNDHAGTDLKRRVMAKFRDDFEFVDCGTDGEESVDYPDYSKKVCDMVLANNAECGIIILLRIEIKASGLAYVSIR